MRGNHGYPVYYCRVLWDEEVAWADILKNEQIGIWRSSIHSFIFSYLSGSGLQSSSLRRCLDFPLPGHLLQLIRLSVGTPKETGIGSRETCSTQHVLGLIQVSSQLGIPETSHLEGIQEPSNQMPEAPQLAPFSVEGYILYLPLSNKAHVIFKVYKKWPY